MISSAHRELIEATYRLRVLLDAFEGVSHEQTREALRPLIERAKSETVQARDRLRVELGSGAP